MGSVTGIVSDVSTDVVNRLSAAGYPPLTDGKILLGRHHLREQSAPPRIVAVPTKSVFGPREMNSTSNVLGYPKTADLAQWNNPSVQTDRVYLQFYVWAQATPADPDGGDFDAVEILYRVVQASIWDLTTGICGFEGGLWIDQQLNKTQLIKAGHAYMFTAWVNTPVTDILSPYAPSNVSANPTTIFVGPNGTEQGCTG